MALTRGNILDRIEGILGDDDTDFRTYLETSFNHCLHMLFDAHDWEWKHKDDYFNTTSTTEMYDLSSNALVHSGAADIRSAQDIEVMWDKTNGRFIKKVDLRDIRKHYPKSDNSGQPYVYAPWGAYKVFLADIPNGIFEVHYLYLRQATESTADADFLEATLGLPKYVHYLLEKMVLSEGMLYYDDNRRNGLLEEIGTPENKNTLMFNAVKADMKHLESGARFKFWNEELAPMGLTYDDFLRRVWANDGGNY